MLVFRVGLILALVLIHTKNGLDFKCDLDRNLAIFYFGILGVYTAIALLSVFIAVVSSRGTIMNPKPRQALPFLLTLRLILGIGEIAINIYGSIYFFKPAETEKCHDSFMKDAMPFAQAIIIISWFFFLATCFSFFVMFDPLGGQPLHQHGTFDFEASENVQVWERRCKWLCFCFAGSQAEYSDIGFMLAEYFHDTDLTATDIAAGLALLASKRQESCNHKNHPPHFELEAIPNWMNLNNALHFMPYAAAMYGWPFYIFNKGCSGCCNLCGSSSRNCCLAAAREAQVFGDNCCRCNLATLKLVVPEIDYRDIVALELRNRLYEVPFMVCVDHTKKVIVVAIRGTMSLADAVTDITARAETFAREEVPADVADRESSCEATWYVHKGMLMAARWVVSRLLHPDNGVLKRAFERNPECSQGVVVVGHSLGAGTAALVTILLKNRNDELLRDCDIRCFSYAPPGGLISESLNKQVASSIICGVTLSGDLVPRLSLSTMMKLKNDLLKSLRECRQPKHRIFGGILCSKACCVKTSPGDSGDQNSETGFDVEIGNSDYQSLLPNEENAVTPQTPVTARSLVAQPKLYPPGIMLTLNEQRDALTNNRQYVSTFCDSSKCFNNIIIGSNMITHHLPHSLHDALLTGPTEIKRRRHTTNDNNINNNDNGNC